jgi:hypothetical protein
MPAMKTARSISVGTAALVRMPTFERMDRPNSADRRARSRTHPRRCGDGPPSASAGFPRSCPAPVLARIG